MKNFYEINSVREKDYKTSWNIYPKILKTIELKKEDKILDAGCGEGLIGTFLKGYRLYGIDFSKKAVNIARKRGYEKVVVGKLSKIKFKNKSFDKTLSIQVFQYLTNPEKDFKELLRLTKKEIIISVPNFTWLKIKSFFSQEYRKIYEKALGYVNYTDSSFLRNLAIQNNLKLRIKYISNKGGFFRNIFGKFLSSEILGIYELK